MDKSFKSEFNVSYGTVSFVGFFKLTGNKAKAKLETGHIGDLLPRLFVAENEN